MNWFTTFAGEGKLLGHSSSILTGSNHPNHREAVKQGAVKIGRPSDVWSLGIILCDRQSFGGAGWGEDGRLGCD